MSVRPVRWGLLGLALWGCGGLECGKDTVEKDGQCVPAEEAPDDEDVPDLVLTPAEFDFGQLEIPCRASSTIQLENAGASDLVISEIAYRSESGALTLDAASLPPLPLTLAPGETAEVSVTFEAMTEGTSEGELIVSSNDPDGDTSATQTASAGYGRVQTDAFVARAAPVDVLLLIDQSCSMEDDNRDDVEIGVPLFLEALSAADWQLLQVTRESGCGNGGVLDASIPNLAQLLVEHAWDYTFGFTYYTEALLQLASLALAQTDPGECNEGFLRPGAELHIVVVSDEPEQSGRPPSDWVADFQSYVPDVVISGALDINTLCGLGPDSYAQAIQATGGVMLDICTAGWGSEMGALVADLEEADSQTLTLSEPALEETIEVRVDGTIVSDFSYDPATGVVTLQGAYPEGTPIEVSYAVPGECSP